MPRPRYVIQVERSRRNRSPVPGVDTRKSDEVARVARGQGDHISGGSDKCGLGGEDCIGIKTLVSGCRKTAPAYICPEFSRPPDDGSRDRVVR